MCNRLLLLVAASFAGVVPVNQAAAHQTARPEISFLACQGETFAGPYSEAELDAGAYSVWCVDATGRYVGRMDHGPVVGEETIVVTYIHYDDANRNGALERWEVDGRLTLSYPQATAPEGLPRRLAIDGRQILVALEVSASEIDLARGWFAGTRQVINRNNVVIDDADPSVFHVIYVNFGVYAFVRSPLHMSP